MLVQDIKTGTYSIIGVATDGPYTIDQFENGPVNTFSRVAAVLPWISDQTKNQLGLSMVHKYVLYTNNKCG